MADTPPELPASESSDQDQPSEQPVFVVNDLPIDAEQIRFSPGPGWVGVYTEVVQFSVAPGNKFTTDLTLFNRGPELDTFTLSATDVPAAWLPAPPPPTPVTPGGQQTIKLTLQPPRAPHSRAGRYPMTIQVASRNDPQQVVEVRMSFTVAAYSEFSSVLDPQRLPAGERAQVTVHNQGNTPETFTLAWQDQNDELAFEPPEAEMLVPEGHSVAAEFGAQLKRPRLIGDAAAHPFTVQVTSPAGQTETLTGEFMSRGLLSSCLALGLLIACLALVGIVGLVYGIDSNQRAAGATQTAYANQTAIAAADSDGDGLANIDEVRQGTDALKADTDGDGLSDGDERKFGSNPLLMDSDGDNLADGQEALQLRTSPTNPDTDGDGLNDNVDPDPLNLPSATPVPPTLTFTPLPTLTPLPSATPLPTTTPLPATNTLPPPPASNTPVPPSPSPAPLRGEQIIFESRRDGNPELYAMSVDGVTQIRLTNNLAEDTNPVLSPGSSRIAFESKRDGNLEIYLMNLDGSGQIRLTSNSTRDSGPAWSPDGTRLAFESERDGNLEIYVMNPDGSGQTRLTNNPATECCLFWSSDGAKVAFFSNRDGRPGLYVMNRDGSAPTRLADSLPSAPAWSPDGARLAFLWDTDGSATVASVEIYVINVDGSGKAQLTNNAAVDSGPRWSPDSTRLAFLSDRDGNQEVYVMNVDGSAQSRLTSQAANECCLVWSPDGERLAFASDRDGNYEIYLMNFDGNELLRLTTNAAYDAPFAWRP